MAIQEQEMLQLWRKKYLNSKSMDDVKMISVYFSSVILPYILSLTLVHLFPILTNYNYIFGNWETVKIEVPVNNHVLQTSCT